MPKVSAKSKLLKKKKNSNKNKRNQKNAQNSKQPVLPNATDEEEKQSLHEQQRALEQLSDIEHDDETQMETDLTHLLQPMQAHDLKNGMWCIDDKSGFPGQVSQIKRSAPGKHGHAKFNYKLVCPFNGKTSNPMHAASDQLYKAVMSKDEYLFVRIVDEQQTLLECRELNGKRKVCRIKMSTQAKAMEKVLNSVEKQKKGEKLIVTVLSGPKHGKKKTELVQCVVSAKLVDDA